ncbi:3-oxo-5-alpha-steroid 4-dehydrogenase 2-like isoform X2 [Petromyzon marinus]
MAYGRFWDREGRPRVMLPARLAWCTQEMPSLAVPVILLLVHVGSSERGSVDTVNIVHLAMFCGHYFQRTFIFSLLSRGRPTSLSVMVKAFVFCTLNGYLQSYNLLKCKSYPSNWLTDARFLIGSIIFLAGVAMNIHSDWILRNLRKPGEYVYRIPRGGLFELVSGANFLGEIVEWIGYALATWTFPAFAFAIFTIGCIGPRALHHHRWGVPIRRTSWHGSPGNDRGVEPSHTLNKSTPKFSRLLQSWSINGASGLPTRFPQ